MCGGFYRRWLAPEKRVAQIAEKDAMPWLELAQQYRSLKPLQLLA